MGKGVIVIRDSLFGIWYHLREQVSLFENERRNEYSASDPTRPSPYRVQAGTPQRTPRELGQARGRLLPK